MQPPHVYTTRPPPLPLPPLLGAPPPLVLPTSPEPPDEPAEDPSSEATATPSPALVPASADVEPLPLLLLPQASEATLARMNVPAMASRWSGP
jgi:hypothetical protein